MKNLITPRIEGRHQEQKSFELNYTTERLRNVDFLVVQDLFFTYTAEHADVILPAVPSLEKEGTFTITERSIQRLYQVLDPIGKAKPDWLIITEIAQAMGYDWNYNDPAEIMDEVASLAPLFNALLSIKTSYKVIN